MNRGTPAPRAFRPGPFAVGLFRALSSNPAAQNAIAGAFWRFVFDGDAERPAEISTDAWQALRAEWEATARKAAALSRARAAAGRRSGTARRALRDARPADPSADLPAAPVEPLPDDADPDAPALPGLEPFATATGGEAERAGKGPGRAEQAAERTRTPPHPATGPQARGKGVAGAFPPPLPLRPASRRPEAPPGTMPTAPPVSPLPSLAPTAPTAPRRRPSNPGGGFDFRAALAPGFAAVPEEMLRGEMFADAVDFAVYVSGECTARARRTFGARLKRLGRSAFLEECETFRAELGAGEPVRNAAAALTARLNKRTGPPKKPPEDSA